nr:LCP family protein [Nocardia stercoris]
MRHGDRRQRGRLLAAGTAAVVLLVTGVGWHSVATIVSSIDRISNLGLGGADDGSTDILLVGVDSRTDAHGNPLSDADRIRLHAGDDVSTNTDTIILLRVPGDGRSATALSIPRDTYVDIPGVGMGKINSAYGTTKEAARKQLVEQGISEAEAERRSTLAGRQALIKTVGQLTGVTVDHYAEIGMLGFALLTDAVGGIPVCLNAAVDEPMSGADFPAGPQRLNGAQALSFVRQRHELPRGDLDRIVRQQVFMAALVHQMISAQLLTSPTRLQHLSDALGRTVVLDDGWNVLSFARELHDLSGGQVKFETIPVTDINYMTDAGQSVVRVDPDAVRAYVSATTGRTAGGLDPASVSADVYNAGGVPGLAGQVAEVLAGHGYRTGTVDNWIGGPVPGSRVLAANRDDPKAQAVAKALGGLPVIADPGAGQGAVRVVLTGDYSGPGLPAATPVASSGSEPSAVPAPAPPPLDAGQNGPKCVN